MILSVDDTEQKFTELYDPNIKEFYGINALPQQIWTPSEMIKKELWESCGYMSREDSLDCSLETFKVGLRVVASRPSTLPCDGFSL